MTTTSKLTTTYLDFKDGATQNARITASANTLTLQGAGGTAAITLTNLQTPTVASDAVNKSYVDGLVVSGVTWKNAAIAATTANIASFTSVTVIDGVTLATGDRVVVKNQTTATENGIYSYTLGTTTLARSTDAAAGSPANGAAIFVYAGTANNDKAFVVTNDSAVNWDGGVTWSVMSSVPAVVIGGADTQVQYNNSGSLGADGSFTYNKTSATPVLGLGGAATGLTTLNMGTGSQASTIAGLGTGLLTVSGAGATTVKSTSANLTLAAATSGNVVIDTATNDWTFNGTGLSSAGAATVSSTAANLTLAATTSGSVVVDTATNDWTFNGTTLSSAGAFTTEAAVTSNVSLFATTTSGTITLGNATAGTGTITIDGDTSAINVGPTTTGAISIGSSAAGAIVINSSSSMTVAANSTSVVIGSVATTTSSTLTGQDVNIGSSTTTTTDITGISVDVGSSVTTSLDLLATGASGAVVMTAGSASTSGTVSISTTTATTATVAGGEIDLTAGNGNTTGAGGALDFNAGNGGATGAGGAVTVNAGNGGATSGAGGHVVIQGGSAAAVGSAGNTILKVAMAGTSTATNNLIEFQNNAGTQIGRMENSGDFYAVSVNTTSDVKYKTNIEHLCDPLGQLKKIEGYSYNWKKDFAGYTDKLQYGVLAQQIEEAGLHHLVAGTEESKAVNYTGLIPLLIEAVKELSNKLEIQNTPKKVGRPKKNSK